MAPDATLPTPSPIVACGGVEQQHSPALYVNDGSGDADAKRLDYRHCDQETDCLDGRVHARLRKKVGSLGLGVVEVEHGGGGDSGGEGRGGEGGVCEPSATGRLNIAGVMWRA